jgi:large subunit ribosomal protein L25
MSSITQNVGALPSRLRNFFARYPPQIYSSLVASRPTAPEGEASADETLPSPYTPDRDAKGARRPDPEAFSTSRALLYNDPKNQNPFLPRKIFNSKKWMGPRYGLRQQADLVKLAIKYNVEPLLPPGPKSTEYKAAKLAERGLRIKGTGIGQKVKGHKWERTMEARLEERRKAMVEMPEMIRLWKQVSIVPIDLVMGTSLTLSRREVMVVDGDSGRSGEGDAEALSENIVLVLSIVSHWSTLAISVCALARPFPLRVESPRQKHLYESLQGFGMGVLFLLRHYFLFKPCTIYSVGILPNDIREAQLKLSRHCVHMRHQGINIEFYLYHAFLIGRKTIALSRV